MTFESIDIIETMLCNDGQYPGDPQAALIYEYEHSSDGKRLWAVFMDESHDDISESPYVNNPKLLWSREHMVEIKPLGITVLLGLTPYGEEFLKQQNEARKANAITKLLE